MRRHAMRQSELNSIRCPVGLRLRLCAGYAFYYLSKGLFLVAAIPILLVLMPFPHWRRYWLGRIARGYLGILSRRVLPGLGLYRVAEVSGLDPALRARPAVFVASHRSRMDGPFVLGLLSDTGVVLKAKEGRQWSFALLMRFVDFIAVRGGSLSGLQRALERARAVLAGGRSLLVFPEGTRAPTGRLQMFHGLAFRLACEAGVPVVPVIVHSRLPFMARVPGSYFPSGPNTFRVRFLDPVSVRPDDDPRDLGDRVRMRMMRELKELDAATPWEIGEVPVHD